MKVNFFNTFELVIPLWEYAADYFSQRDIDIRGIVLNRSYRKSSNTEKDYLTVIKMPRLFGKSKLASHVFYFISAPFYLLFKKSDLNVFFTQPPMFYIVGGFISRIIRKPYIVYIMDYYPDFFYVAKSGSKNHILRKLFNRLAISSLKKSFRIIVIGDCMHKYIFEKGISKELILTIPNVTDQNIVPISSKRNIVFTKYPFLKDKFIILYSGNMGRAHVFDNLIIAARKLKNNNNIIFAFSGGGFRKSEIDIEIRENRINGVFLKAHNDNEFVHLLSAASVHFISLRDDFTGLVVPSKFYSSIASGRPIIYEGKGEISTNIINNNLGFVISNGNHAKLIIDKIDAYYKSKDLLSSQMENCREFHENNYEIGVYKELYLSKFEKVILESKQ